MGINFTRLLIRDDYVEFEINEEKKYYRKPVISSDNVTRFDRVKAIFEKDVHGDLSPDLMRSKDVTMMSVLMGAIVGALYRGQSSAEKFIRLSAHEKFETPRYAQKQLQDRVMLGSLTGAYRVGWRMGAFSFMYMTSAAMVSAWRGTNMTLFDQSVGAGVAGCLYKFKQGPKASVAGFIFGGAFGLFFGIISNGSSRLLGPGGIGMVEWHLQTIQQRKILEKDNLKRERYKDEDPDIQFHEHFMTKDDLSMSTVKGSSINNIMQAIEKKDVEVLDFAAFPPLAIKHQIDEEMAKLKKSQSSPAPNNDTAKIIVGTPSELTSPQETSSPHKVKPVADQRLYSPGKVARKNY